MKVEKKRRGGGGEKERKKRESDRWDVTGFWGPQSPPIYEHVTENQILSYENRWNLFLFSMTWSGFLCDWVMKTMTRNSSKTKQLVVGSTKFKYWAIKTKYWVKKTLKPNKFLMIKPTQTCTVHIILDHMVIFRLKGIIVISN